MTGAKLSRPKARRRRALGWLALAAAVAVLFSVAGVGYYRARSSGGLSGFAQFALNDAHQGGHIGDPDQPLNSWLTTSQEPLDGGALPVSVAQLRETGCRSLNFAGARVFEVCFQRGEIVYHLYLLPKPDSSGLHSAEQRVELSGQEGAAAAWSDAHFVYALATQAGTAMLRRVL